MMPNKTATQNPLTSNPFNTDEARRISRALMIKVNKPSVRILIGKVINNSIGFIRTLTTPKKSATHKALKKLLTVTPGTR